MAVKCSPQHKKDPLPVGVKGSTFSFNLPCVCISLCCKAKAAQSLWASSPVCNESCNRQIAAQRHTAEPKFPSGISLNKTANSVLWMTEESSLVKQEAVWKVNFKAAKGACWGSEFPLPSLPHLLCQDKSNLSSSPRDWASSDGSLRLPPAGRCHVGRGRENNTQPTSLRNSLCGGALGHRQSWHHPALGPRCTDL